MEDFFAWLCLNSQHAYWMVFVIFFFAGLCLPVSEDIVLLSAGALANLCLDGSSYLLYLCCFFAAWFSDWQIYWIGRLLGPKLYDVPWLNRMVNKDRIDTLHHYYEKYGVFTFIIGRFIPGGFRNALFLTSGMGKMPFLTYIMRDGIACFISTATMFSIGYTFAEYRQDLILFIKKFNLVGLAFIILIIMGIVYWKKRKGSHDYNS